MRCRMRMYRCSSLLLFGALLFLIPSHGAQAQITDTLPVFDYSKPKDYEIGGITVTGAKYSDETALKSIAGFRVGDKIRIPGGDIPRAMKALWNLRLFTDIQILQEKTLGDIVFLEIVVQERPRYTKHSFRGVKKSTHDDLNEEVNKYLVKGGIVTENAKVNASTAIADYFRKKGYLDAQVNVLEIADSSRVHSVRLVFDVDQGDRIKIQDITFSGNDNAKDRKLRKLLDDTKRKSRLFASSKFIRTDYEEDKKSLITYYNTIGFRDAAIASDSIWREPDGDLRIHINVDEGNRYYFRNISWKGNSIYESDFLSEVLGIAKGEVYNQELLETRLRFSQDGRDISTLYMDNGYLFFQVDPIEVAVAEDSIDLEIRIFEGPQATIDKVVIKGNDRTHEHVIRRELRTLPGEKFSRSDIIRSQREIINLGYFNPESLGINTPINPQRGTVDIEYTVEEKPSDQLELSAGWGGAGRGVIGTLGVSFNNFSVRNIFNKEAWSPLPQGDGQRLSLRAQTNGRFFQSYNISFTEPWLGGKKPNSFTVGGFYTILTNGLDREDSGFGSFTIGGTSLSLGTRLKWPDDNFISTTALNLQTLSLDNWLSGVFRTDNGEVVTEGKFYNFSITQSITRSSINNPLFPQEGSRFTLSAQLTIPYSLFNNKDYSGLDAQERFRWLEYHKWRFTAEWYTTLVGKLTLKTEAKIGMIGAYNNNVGVSPFERFQLGGDGLNNVQFGQFNGTDIVSMRGYEISDLEANFIDGRTVATPIFDKFTAELRYPLSLNPNSTIYVLAFAQGGNAWQSFRDFNPFDIKRSAGIGLRVFLPMFGVLGFDYGLGFDKNAPETGSIFSRYGDFNIILGFEPE
ncbi:MAG: outer membrane protein assembly factor BamA [Saprospiraceae bacterium]|nr:outer membrane protein assembly factor BamA [Saprospiraceae bacterium]MCB0677175.1 outer membrane protein assembly factor BamA [Saprospiraceae bacterium]MCB0683023.1 outer membrane protein assembly factor BamA [Saprospiraceae bacterium]